MASFMITFEGCQRPVGKNNSLTRLEVTPEKEFCKDPWFKWLKKLPYLGKSIY